MSLDTRGFLLIYRIGNFLFYRKDFFCYKILYFAVYAFYRILEVLFGCSIPFSSNLGKDICFKHGVQGVFISSKAVIGDRVTIMHQVTIGSNYYSSDENIFAPVIGDDVFIGPGAKIIGKTIIMERSKVGPNAVVVNKICAHGTYVAPIAQELKEIK